ncbi:MAG: ABC transporter ATP-binding protein [Flavobacteriaceae bacterium]|nr:ABC transporter ATP-binding protein [Bacteroidia bacterium]NNL60380.1 ABC transporter ATP-binding protein [Flavobacteriaceae bacterium]
MKDSANHTVLKTNALSIGYRSKNNESIIASNITIQLGIGELIGLVGANGIGKSTLLRTLTKVQPSISGEIFIGNRPIEDHSSIQLAKALSLVLTEYGFSKNLTVYELIALGRHPYTNWIGTLSQNDKNIIEKVIGQTGIENLKEKKCYELSDGQLQKVMIARALAQDTQLIILDEPTTHLDMYHKAYILNLLKKLASDTGKTILFSSHEIDLAIQLCDKLIVMTEAQVISGTPKEHISKGSFNNLFPKDLIVFDVDSGSFKVKK